ncbi:MAG: hypothetical protein E7581_01645 [Ruminococcaceae bacterium]|nr:hypothetical protein [Oscillospiraceae bacterium]
MKRNISLLLLVCTLLLCLISCGNQNESGSSSNGNSSNGNSSTNTTNYDPNTKAELSVSDRQDLAEKELLAETFRSFTSQSYLNYYTIQEQKFNIDATRYRIGSVQRNGNTFKFYITFYFYDNYGNVKAVVEKTGEVDVDIYGNVERVIEPSFYDMDFY